MVFKLNTMPPIRLNPVYYYRLKDGTLKAYWKAEIHAGGRKHYLRYVPQRDAEALLSGRLDPISYFSGLKGWVIRPAEPAKRRTYSITRYVRVNYVGDASGERGVRYPLILKVLLVRKRGRVYVYAKRVEALYKDLTFPFPKNEKLQYLGRCDEAWGYPQAMKPLLEARGYFMEELLFRPSRGRRGRPRKQPEVRGESVEDWGFEAKSAAYETWGEEAYIDEVETWGEEAEIADRELWGDEADDE